MKKLLCGGASALLLCALLSAASFKKGANVYVNVKTAQVKSGTGLFAKNVAAVSYGQNLVVVQSDGKKTQVSIPSTSITGWISTGSLTTKKISGSSGSYVAASQSELALAGKGFSAEAENAFKTSNSRLDYKDVDEIEKIAVSDDALEQFIIEGKLAGGEQ